MSDLSDDDAGIIPKESRVDEEIGPEGGMPQVGETLKNIAEKPAVGGLPKIETPKIDSSRRVMEDAARLGLVRAKLGEQIGGTGDVNQKATEEMMKANEEYAKNSQPMQGQRNENDNDDDLIGKSISKVFNLAGRAIGGFARGVVSSFRGKGS